MDNSSHPPTETEVTRVHQYQIIELDDGLFPNFYINHAGLVNQLRSWIEIMKVKAKVGIRPSPALLVEPPKTGKTALLSRIAPAQIIEAYANSEQLPLICIVDFVKEIQISRRTGIDRFSEFAAVFARFLRKWATLHHLAIETDNSTASAPQQLMDIFENFDKAERIIYFLFDEVQMWFQLDSGLAAKMFDSITFHKNFKNLHFCVTGSAMVMVYCNLLTFETNGNRWLSAAEIIAPVSCDTTVEVNAVAAATIFELGQRYGKLCPSTLIDYCLDSSPAMLCYFMEHHYGKSDQPRDMRGTNKKVQEKIFGDFQRDMVPILEQIRTQNFNIFKEVMALAFGVKKIPDCSPEEILEDVVAEHLEEVLGTWTPIFAPLICRNEYQYLIFRGYYGSLFPKAFTPTGKLTVPRNLVTFPVPGYFATIDLIQGRIEKLSDDRRQLAEAVSVDVFSRENVSIPVFENDPTFTFFAQRASQAVGRPAPATPSANTPHLTYFRYIRHTVSHLRSLGDVQAAATRMPMYIYPWCTALYFFLFSA